MTQPAKRTLAFSFAAFLAFYRKGFSEMTLGRTLWKVILIKLAVLFLLIRPAFYVKHAVSETWISDQLIPRPPHPSPGVSHAGPSSVSHR